MEYKRFNDSILARLDPGEEILASVREIALKEEIKLASVSGLGAVNSFTVGVFKTAEKEYKAEQKRLKAYNKSLKDARETELPPLYEPLVLNCDLLFALADEVGISKKEMVEVEDILRTEENGVFLSKPVNDRYSFTTTKTDYNIELSKDEINVPVNLLTAGAEIIVTVSDGGKTTTFDDCIVSKVERRDDTIDTFKATVSSKKMKDYSWTENSKVTIKIINGDNNDPLVFKFKVTEFKDNWLIADKVVFAEE